MNFFALSFQQITTTSQVISAFSSEIAQLDNLNDLVTWSTSSSSVQEWSNEKNADGKYNYMKMNMFSTSNECSNNPFSTDYRTLSEYSQSQMFAWYNWRSNNWENLAVSQKRFLIESMVAFSVARAAVVRQPGPNFEITYAEQINSSDDTFFSSSAKDWIMKETLFWNTQAEFGGPFECANKNSDGSVRDYEYYTSANFNGFSHKNNHNNACTKQSNGVDCACEHYNESRNFPLVARCFPPYQTTILQDKLNLSYLKGNSFEQTPKLIYGNKIIDPSTLTDSSIESERAAAARSVVSLEVPFADIRKYFDGIQSSDLYSYIVAPPFQTSQNDVIVEELYQAIVHPSLATESPMASILSLEFTGNDESEIEAFKQQFASILTNNDIRGKSECAKSILSPTSQSQTSLSINGETFFSIMTSIEICYGDMSAQKTLVAGYFFTNFSERQQKSQFSEIENKLQEVQVLIIVMLFLAFFFIIGIIFFLLNRFLKWNFEEPISIISSVMNRSDTQMIAQFHEKIEMKSIKISMELKNLISAINQVISSVKQQVNEQDSSESVAFNQGQEKKYLFALQQFQIVDHQTGIGLCENNLGVMYRMSGQTSKSLQFFKRACLRSMIQYEEEIETPIRTMNSNDLQNFMKDQIKKKFMHIHGSRQYMLGSTILAYLKEKSTFDETHRSLIEKQSVVDRAIELRKAHIAAATAAAAAAAAAASATVSQSNNYAGTASIAININQRLMNSVNIKEQPSQGLSALDITMANIHTARGGFVIQQSATATAATGNLNNIIAATPSTAGTTPTRVEDKKKSVVINPISRSVHANAINGQSGGGIYGQASIANYLINKESNLSSGTSNHHHSSNTVHMNSIKLASKLAISSKIKNSLQASNKMSQAFLVNSQAAAAATAAAQNLANLTNNTATTSNNNMNNFNLLPNAMRESSPFNLPIQEEIEIGGSHLIESAGITFNRTHNQLGNLLDDIHEKSDVAVSQRHSQTNLFMPSNSETKRPLTYINFNNNASIVDIPSSKSAAGTGTGTAAAASLRNNLRETTTFRKVYGSGSSNDKYSMQQQQQQQQLLPSLAGAGGTVPIRQETVSFQGPNSNFNQTQLSSAVPSFYAPGGGGGGGTVDEFELYNLTDLTIENFEHFFSPGFAKQQHDIGQFFEEKPIESFNLYYHSKESYATQAMELLTESYLVFDMLADHATPSERREAHEHYCLSVLARLSLIEIEAFILKPKNVILGQLKDVKNILFSNIVLLEAHDRRMLNEMMFLSRLPGIQNIFSFMPQQSLPFNPNFALNTNNIMHPSSAGQYSHQFSQQYSLTQQQQQQQQLQSNQNNINASSSAATHTHILQSNPPNLFSFHQSIGQQQYQYGMGSHAMLPPIGSVGEITGRQQTNEYLLETQAADKATVPAGTGVAFTIQNQMQLFSEFSPTNHQYLEGIANLNQIHAASLSSQPSQPQNHPSNLHRKSLNFTSSNTGIAAAAGAAAATGNGKIHRFFTAISGTTASTPTANNTNSNNNNIINSSSNVNNVKSPSQIGMQSKIKKANSGVLLPPIVGGSNRNSSDGQLLQNFAERQKIINSAQSELQLISQNNNNNMINNSGSNQLDGILPMRPHNVSIYTSGFKGGKFDSLNLNQGGIAVSIAAGGFGNNNANANGIGAGGQNGRNYESSNPNLNPKNVKILNSQILFAKYYILKGTLRRREKLPFEALKSFLKGIKYFYKRATSLHKFEYIIRQGIQQFCEFGGGGERSGGGGGHILGGAASTSHSGGVLAGIPAAAATGALAGGSMQMKMENGGSMLKIIKEETEREEKKFFYDPIDTLTCLRNIKEIIDQEKYALPEAEKQNLLSDIARVEKEAASFKPLYFYEVFYKDADEA